MLSVLMVDLDAASGGNGLAWATACNDLQPALSQAATLNADADPANNVDQIWIAEGTYKPSAELESGDARSASFSLVNGVTLYGGFAGTETTLDERDWSARVTTLSGDLGTPGDAADNAYTVVYCATGITSGVDGLSITGGNANGSSASTHPERRGGAGIFSKGTLTVNNSVVSGNSAEDGGGIFAGGMLTVGNSVVSGNSAVDGGGIYAGGVLTVMDSIISDNSTPRTASGRGGGIYFFSGTLNLNGSILSGNSAISGYGGGICNAYGTLNIVGSTFSANSVAQGNNGGGIYSDHGTLNISDSAFSGNAIMSSGSGKGYGGAISSNYATVTINDSTFSYNSASYVGGAIYTTHGSLAVTNSTFWHNMAAGYSSCGAGAIYTDNGPLTLTNCTLWGNLVKGTSTSSGGGIVVAGGSSATLNNTVVAGNVASSGGPDVLCSSSTLRGSYNLIGDGSGQSTLVNGVNGNQVGTTASPIDPLLSDWTRMDNGAWGCRLLPGSPAVDAGGNSLAVDTAGQPLAEDMCGNPRIVGSTVDIGAVEGTTASRSAQTYTVMSLANTIANDGVLTFIEAFQAANGDQPVGDAPAGSFTEQDTIRFVEGLSGTVLVDDGELEIVGDLHVEGPGDELLTLQANHRNRVLLVRPGVSVVIEGATITGGFSNCGAGIYNAGSLAIIDSTVSDNKAITLVPFDPLYSPILGDGAGIYNCNTGTLTVSRSTISHNSSTSWGGGIENLGAMTVADSTISGNSALSGGGIDNEGTLTIADSTLWTNSASTGGGIYVDSGTLTITNSTLWGNTAIAGGGITISGHPTLKVTNSTISANSGGTGAGIFMASGSFSALVTLNNTIVAGNGGQFESEICGSSTISGAYNLIGNGSDQSSLKDGVNGNQVGTFSSPIDPLLSDWTQFSSGLWGYYLLPGSPAVNTGSNALAVDPAGQPLAEDIGGNPRIVDGAVDIGAVEGVTGGSTSGETYTVTSLAETIANDGVLTFLEAFEAASGNQPAGDAPAGSFTQMDTIRFADGLTGTILVDDGELAIMGDLSIEGPGAGLLTFQASGLNRVFFVSPGVLANLDGITVTGGSSRWGGGIYSAGVLTITDSVITGNSAQGGEMVTDAAAGGGICSSGTLIVNGCTLSGNSVTGKYGSGGAVDSDGTLTIMDSTLSGNSASAGGGIASYGAMTLANCTLLRNTGSSGGGIYIYIYNSSGSSSTSILNNTVVAENAAPSGPDVYLKAGTLSGAYSLIGNGTGQTQLVNDVNGNQVGTTAAPIDPKLDTAGRPLAGSPAINKGSNTLAVDAQGNPLTVDLDGRPRVIYGTVDVGAYEYCLVADADYSGTVDSADARVLATHWGKSALGFADGDFNADGQVNAADAAILAANWGATFSPPAAEGRSPKSEGRNAVAQAVPDMGPFLPRSSVRQSLSDALPVRHTLTDIPPCPSVVKEDRTAETTDAVLAEAYGPSIGSTVLGHSRLAWSRILTRRR